MGHSDKLDELLAITANRLHRYLRDKMPILSAVRGMGVW
jgi:hypothetical protein